MTNPLQKIWSSMETISSPILHTPSFCGRATAGAAGSTPKLLYLSHGNHFRCNSQFTCPNKIHCYSQINNRLRSDRLICNASARNPTEQSPSQNFAVLIEVEGKLGLDCANWTEPVYVDLVRKSAGDEERMLVLYFNRIGWPTAVATNEKGTFMKNVLREKKNALDDLVMSEALTLRPGAEEFIDNAFEQGIPVIILTAYGPSGEKIARSIAEKLGSERMSRTKVVGDEEVKQSFYGQLVFGKGAFSSLDEQLAKEVSKAASAERQRIAEEVASMLKLKVELNNNSSESLQNIVAALRAGAEYAEVQVEKCVLVAGSQSGVAAAERIGMPCVVLRSSSTSRAEFPSAVAVMDGFGGADLTISRLRRKFTS
ncbi:Haloacid dehalogenase-like hydrolase (HAD) superfamily protein [Striga hermonthica]|uniref:Haloacid dehalogenase-like hydrolase (HAD) superfamily protein n=1 Tax=Striga hermonthica TaxID=68872 RepID=A0A9N7RE44_STRHE|nr:Haloacid dehalogenase-like hydrolase (HAD) superfamily protein [Striga hermonthica]